MPRPKTKTIAATVRLSPDVRAAWEAAATHERRSLTSLLEVALLEYVKRHRIPVASHPTPNNENI